jgi:hypothetical protein
MLNYLARSFLIIVLAAAIAAGFTTHTVRAGDTNATAIATATGCADMSMPGRNGCADDQQGVAQGACVAPCIVVAALSPAAVAGVDAIFGGTVGPTIGPAAVGHVIPPDPHPPKSSHLS